jgi:hypothetical protein
VAMDNLVIALAVLRCSVRAHPVCTVASQGGDLEVSRGGARRRSLHLFRGEVLQAIGTALIALGASFPRSLRRP